MYSVILEAGCCHQGEMEIAKRMILIASSYCSADAIKFQKRTLSLMSDEARNRPYENANSFGKTYGEHREALEFSIEQHKELQRFCKVQWIEYSCSVWDIEAAKQIAELNPPFIKIPSAANTDFKMMRWLLENYKGSLHISMGMTTIDEKLAIRRFVSKNPQRFVVYHCVSAYPCPHEKLFIRDIRDYSGWARNVGYSGHHGGIAVDIAAIILGAHYIERHFTLDRTWKGTDHAASLEPDGARKLVRDIWSVNNALKKSNGDIIDIEVPVRKKLKG